MLVAQSKLERRQAIVGLGIHQFDPTALSPGIPPNQYRALIDTGATRTCLTYRAIGVERLLRHGRKLVKNVHNENLHGLYMATLGIFTTHRSEGNELIASPSYFGFEDPIEVIDIADNERFDAILGMDLLQKYDFTFFRDGEFQIRLE
jgi:hypothetical protein